MPLTSGSRLGPYEIVAPLGAGGMGEVYRARDPRLGREVALKVLPAEVAADPQRLARLEREARTVASLNHPNIVTLFSVEDAQGVRFLTMELVEGESLERILTPGGLPAARVLELGMALCDAVAAAHQRGIVHRDLKPANIMLTRAGALKVLDFGLARPEAGAVVAGSTQAETVAAPLTASGDVVGTVPYMAPEQLRGGVVDARSDVFALGVILYELACGRRPFTGATAADVGSSILRDPPTPPSRLRSDLPAALERLTMRCLEKEPGARPASAEDVGRELRPIHQDLARAGSAAADPRAIRSLVVLPLDNVSRDAAQEYFADGMTEALISDLSRMRALRVISRTSAMKYKGVQKALPDIARELDVDAVIEGSALLVGQRVRINVQLVSARRDETLWSERYDRDLEDVLTLQSDVAAAVARQIALLLTPSETQRLARRRGVDAAAHIEYLKGNHTAEATSPSAIELSIRHFERALELDPGYAPAWAGLAACRVTQGSRGSVPPAEAFAAARAAARRALELDEGLAEAHAAIGSIHARELDFAGAIRALERAIELNPALSSAHEILGRVYYCSERHAEAQAAMLKALSLDPLSMIIHTTVGDAYYYAREYETSVTYYRRAVALDARFDGAHTDLARSLEALGQFDEARAEYQEGRRLAGTVAGPSFGLAHLEASMGHTEVARGMLAELVAARERRVISAWGIAALHASLGDVDDAFRWLETAVEEKAPGLVFLRVHPRLDAIRGDARYRALLARLGLDRDLGA